MLGVKEDIVLKVISRPTSLYLHMEYLCFVHGMLHMVATSGLAVSAALEFDQ